MNNVKYLPIISRKDSCKLAVDDICYVYRTNRKLQFKTDHGVLHIYGKMDDLEKYLGPDFYRCMSGCIVNVAKIKEMRDGMVYFETAEPLKPGRETYLRLKQVFNAYLLRLFYIEKTGSENDEPE